MDEAYVQIFREHYDSLVRGCTLASAGDQRCAEDAVVEAFIRAYGPWRRGRVDNVGAYLRVVALNELRRLQHRQRPVDDRPTASPADEGRRRPEDSVVDRHEVVELMRQLGWRERQVLVLRFYFDQREQDVADALGLPVGTVKSLVHRSRQRLRQARSVGAADD